MMIIDVLTIKKAKNSVGIMNSAPAYPLDVIGNTNIKGILKIDSATSGSCSTFIINEYNNNASNGYW
jgi:hypothetical protein